MESQNCSNSNRAIVISVTALKGGVGKSTIAINLATCLHSAGNRVLLIDGDPQGTCRNWAAIAASGERNTPPVVSMGSEMRRDLTRIADGWKLVIIDTPPRLGAEQRAAMLVSDVVLIPVSPGPADVWALQETLAVLEEVRVLRPEIRAAIVLNRIDSRTSLSSATKGAVENSGLPVLVSMLGARVAFGESLATGQGVTTYAPRSVATTEISALASEVLGLLKK